jgi:glycosyltransferase involved in cell wall biosynthesis
MKILHAIPSLDPGYGGPAFAFVSLLLNLRRLGADVEALVTFKPTDRFSLLEDLRSAGIPVHLVGPTHLPYDWHPKLLAAVKEQVGRAGVVHAHGLFEGLHWLLASACERQGVPFILRPFGVLSKYSLMQKKLKKSIFMQLAGKRILQRVNCLHLASPKERAELGVDFTAGRVAIVPNGCSAVERLSKGDASAHLRRLMVPDSYNLFLGRIHPIKGLELLLAAYEQAGEQTPPLVIAGFGDPRYLENLKFMARRFGVADRIIWIGEVYGAAKIALLQSAQMILLPSKHENFANVILEGMAVGTPAVISPETGLADIVTEMGAGKVTPRSVEAYLASMEDVRLRFLSESKRRELQLATQQRFAWSNIARQWLEIYEDLKKQPRAC